MKSLVARERDATAQLVAHLAELDTRDVYLREGRAVDRVWSAASRARELVPEPVGRPCRTRHSFGEV